MLRAARVIAGSTKPPFRPALLRAGMIGRVTASKVQLPGGLSTEIAPPSA